MAVGKTTSDKLQHPDQVRGFLFYVVYYKGYSFLPSSIPIRTLTPRTNPRSFLLVAGHPLMPAALAFEARKRNFILL